MRSPLTWLLLFCVCAGLNARVFAVDCGPESECCEVADVCCQENHTSGDPRQDHHEGDGCPVEHHHHSCCSHGLLTGLDGQDVIRLGIADSALLPIRHEGESPPDGPFLGSEKPPLI